MDSNLRVVAILAIGAAVGAVLVLILTDRIEPPALPTPPSSANGPNDPLVASLRSLDERLDTLNRLLEDGTHRVVGVKGDQEAPAMRQEKPPTLSSEVTELTKAVQELVALLKEKQAAESSTPSTSPSLRSVYQRVQHVQRRPLQQIWTTAKEAEKELVLQPYSEVLERLGLPRHIRSMRGAIEWRYRDGHVLFLDGLVSEVVFYGKKK